jgi:hypothetical protein
VSNGDLEECGTTFHHVIAVGSNIFETGFTHAARRSKNVHTVAKSLSGVRRMLEITLPESGPISKLALTASALFA